MPFNGTDSADPQLSEHISFTRGAAILREQAPSLAPYGLLAPLVAIIVKRKPALAARLLCAPRAAFHAVAIYLQHNLDKDIQVIADALVQFSPVELLTELLPVSWTPRLGV